MKLKEFLKKEEEDGKNDFTSNKKRRRMKEVPLPPTKDIESVNPDIPDRTSR
jgi:hypothetical protein